MDKRTGSQYRYGAVRKQRYGTNRAEINTCKQEDKSDYRYAGRPPHGRRIIEDI